MDTAPLEGLSTSTASSWAIVIQPGWNLVANPFSFPVPWSAVQKGAGVGQPVAFDPTLGTLGDYADQAPPNLEPFEGYFIENTSALPETLWVPPIEATGAAEARASTDRNDAAWMLRIEARAGNATDLSNVVGVELGAADGPDALDAGEPPPAPDCGVRLGFIDPQSGTGRLLRRDLRSGTSDGHRWESVVSSDIAGEPIHIDCVPAGPLPPDMELRIIDREQQVEFDPRDAQGITRTYVVLSGGPHRPYRLSIVAGTREYVERNAGHDLSIPTMLVLDRCAPNPTRGPTRIRFGIPHAGRSSSRCTT